ncbi:HK97 family phage prohead protease [Yoonia vestfoldensis]|uniref:Caudovirus prohead serine protease n=1 Tax=Yoonia vestfoldensis TaxID=245188 RepID=A0A1Y0EBN3_9RHOB|nr:HK97 family phage prohead protease [Yoonia vestfoldensis]ARU01024.1 Caudovirus prohead serine protease [Yoonia vestfoldensis]
MILEHKFCTGPQHVTFTDGQVISGYASLFGKSDQGGDIVEPGAYRISLAKGRRIKMLWQHDPAQPIGIWDEVVEDARGLWVKGRLLTDVARAREAASLIAAGAIDGLSIGYRTLRAHKDASGARRLSELDLWEVSLVTFPMLPEARVTAKAEARNTDDLHRLARAFAQARRLLPPL